MPILAATTVKATDTFDHLFFRESLK